MRWEDEHWVKLYTRDTLDWQALGWEGHAVWFEVFRKLDTAGVLDLGKRGAKGFSAAIGMPFDVFERGLNTLLEDGCLVLNGSLLVMPNYVEAQEARKSDRQRQRDSRTKARDAAMSHDVTLESRGVTKAASTVTPIELLSRETSCCHVSSATVAEEKRGEEKRLEEIPPIPPQGGQGELLLSAPKAKKGLAPSEAFAKFWAAYPLHVAKQAAIKAWPGDDLLPPILVALEWQAPAFRKRERDKIPHPATWLNGKRWEDEPTQPARPQAQPVLRFGQKLG